MYASFKIGIWLFKKKRFREHLWSVILKITEPLITLTMTEDLRVKLSQIKQTHVSALLSDLGQFCQDLFSIIRFA